MGNISTYILMITIVSLESYAIYKKEFTLKFTGIVGLLYILQLYAMYYSNIHYLMIVVYLIETVLLNVILIVSIAFRFPANGNEEE